ncbi:methyltransferase-like protein 4 [Lichtheimia corymbifera JMRC:FSU:9682]|uniref:Methyltransferase-like protein 4 n=1 Tax=Lichtheimia corymbifera JMRC:FSU:9682 TaxID=1263082 RepID=A0A068RTR7_9FUNG|nr:methyltransferase-like protein 4 [Lichtheimia corymbifera JMRC:FSU:9682]
MAILFSTQHVDVIDCQAAFSKQLNLHSQPLQLRRGEFSVHEPYYKSSGSTASAGQKRKRQENTADIETENWHQEHARPFLIQCINELPKDVFSHLDNTETAASNDAIGIDFTSLVSLAQASSRFTQKEDHLNLPPGNHVMEPLDVFHRIISNPSTSNAVQITIQDQDYIIPPGASFYMSDMSTGMKDLKAHARSIGFFDFVVMDPPWPNKSVHRSSHYETQDIYDLFKIPMKQLIAPGGLLAVWVTNKPKFRKFVMNKLFPTWNIKLVGVWYWLKVTTSGEPVVPLDSPHRKPYEQLVLGMVMPHQDQESLSTRESIPDTHAIISIPSRRHSRKPPLQDVMAHYLPKDPKCLELFARCLTPHWTSWGNECLKFQHDEYFESVEAIKDQAGKELV